MTADIVLIPKSVSKTGRQLKQNGSKMFVTSECCDLSIMDGGIDERGAYAMFCNGCQKRLAANPERWTSAVYNLRPDTGQGDDEKIFTRWIAFMFGLECAKIEVVE